VKNSLKQTSCEQKQELDQQNAKKEEKDKKRLAISSDNTIFFLHNLRFKKNFPVINQQKD